MREFGFTQSIRGVLVAALTVLAVTFAGSPVHATSIACGNSTYSYNSECSGNSAVAGSTVASSSTVSVSATQTAGLVLNRVSSFRAGSSAPGSQQSGAGTLKLLELGSGKNAGNSDTPIGVWINGAWTTFDGTKSGAKFDGDAFSGMIGADVTLDRLIVGLAAGWESSSVDTKFNNGNLDGSGYTVSPYAAYRINRIFSVDGVLGYSRLSYDENRLDPLSNAQISGNTDANRWFGSLNVVANTSHNQFNLSGKVGTFYLSENQDAFTETDGTAVAKQDLTIGTVSLGGRVGYQLDKVEPYISAQYGYDYNGAGGTYDGKNSYGGAVGVQIDAGNGFTGNLEGTASEKDSVTAYGGSLFLRYNLQF